MLQGILRYTDEHKGLVQYRVFAQDSFDSLKLYIQANDEFGFTNYMNANYVFDMLVSQNSDSDEVEITNAFMEQNPSENRRLDIKKMNKYKSNIVNRTFCSRVSSLLRYAQLSGAQNYNQNLSEADHFSTERLVNIEDVGFIKYEMAIIQELNIKNKYLELVLSPAPDDLFDIAIFKELKQKDKYGHILSVTPIENVGFKLHSDLLGFPYEPPAITASVNLLGMYETIEQVIEANPDKNTSWILERSYHIVTDDELEDVLAQFNDYDGWIAFDTETTGLNINFKSRIGQADQLVGVILSKDKGTGYYFPLQHKLFKNLCDGDHWFFMEKYMRPILEKKKIVVHNGLFDWKVAYIYAINTNILYDTLLAFGVTKRYEMPSFELGLKSLAKNIFGLDMFDLSDFVMSSSFGDSGITFADLPYDLVSQYAPVDGDMTLSLFEYLEYHGILDKYGAQAVFDMEVNFSKVVAYSEFWGYHINVPKIPEMREDIIGGMERYKAEMFEIAGREFNPNSPQQLAKIMYDDLGIEMINDSRSTAKDILKSLADRTNAEGDSLYPFVVALKNYRDNEGIFKNFLKKLHEFATQDGFIFPDVMQLGTNTGRSSVKNPNYQSYNDPVKKNITPREGFMHFDCDFSQIEYRVLASMARQESLMDEFNDPDLDYHTYQASRMFTIPYSLVSKALRGQSKGINFGLPYGMGDSSLGVRIFGERNDETKRKAGTLRRKFFQGQEKIEDFFEVTRSNGVANNFTSTHWGRRRYYNRGKFTVQEIRRQAGNHVIQGCLGGETRIQTKEFGIVKIKDVAGLHLNVWDGERWSNGDITYSGKKQKCVIRFRGGQTMVCSPIHKFLVVSHRGNTRFVECKDLKGTVVSRSPHRVVINRKYEPSDFAYSSDEDYFASVANNSSNSFLEDIGDSFGIGVFLGRLASDGSFSIREDGGTYLTHFVAEHEFSILSILKSYMKPFGFIEKAKDVREGRNQRITELTSYSSSLVREITDLDIKHSIHDNIFMDTELLRGFLRGFFDGDGGISDKTITLVFGTQYDFEPMCLDLQKALLFFGIRSRYRKYDDRHVIQIKTNDNERFLDVVGFVNQEKQDKGRKLKRVEDEHIFGPCLVVESVEITDDFIDMYDVCNTDGGYFVADGVITHNTAADLYKIACNRLWNRCVSEGWLDLVLFNVFVHDELLAEVHQSINPYYFFKAWREEFEVAVEGFCKLFAGAGVGMSWYSAKKQDLPVQYITEIIDQYDEDMEWDENIPMFLKSIEDNYEGYKTQRITEYITDSQNSDEIIKPVIYSLLVEMVDKIVKEVQGSAIAVKLLKEYNSLVGKEIIPVKGKHKIKLLSEYLAVFGHYHNITEQIVGVVSADEATVKPTSTFDTIEEENLVFTDDSFSIDDYVAFNNAYVDEATSVLYFRDKPMVYEGLETSVTGYLINKGFITRSGRYQLACFDEASQDYVVMQAFTSEKGYQMMLKLFSSLKTQQQSPLAFSRASV